MHKDTLQFKGFIRGKRFIFTEEKVQAVLPAESTVGAMDRPEYNLCSAF